VFALPGLVLLLQLLDRLAHLVHFLLKRREHVVRPDQKKRTLLRDGEERLFFA